MSDTQNSKPIARPAVAKDMTCSCGDDGGIYPISRHVVLAIKETRKMMIANPQLTVYQCASVVTDKMIQEHTMIERLLDMPSFTRLVGSYANQPYCFV